MVNLKIIILTCFIVVGCSTKPKQQMPVPDIPMLDIPKSEILNEIKINQIGLKKKIIFDDCVRGTIKSIQNIEWRGDKYFAIVGQTGVWFLTPKEYKVIRKLEYAENNGKTIWFGLSPYLIDIDNDGEYEIVQRGGGYGKVGLLDENGKRIWEFKPNLLLPPKKMLVEDLNKDNVYEFYVIDSDYLYHLDTNRKIIWKRSGSFTDINTIVLNDTTFIVTSLGDTVKIWDIEGKEVKKIVFDRKIYWFDIFNNDGTNYLIRLLDDKIVIFDLSGKIIFKDTLPSRLGYHGPKCILINSKNKRKKLLAISTSSSTAIGKGLLSIYDTSDWKLVYQEILGATEGINVNEGKLLLGDGKNKLWEYYY